jgi:hypothetical protein
MSEVILRKRGRPPKQTQQETTMEPKLPQIGQQPTIMDDIKAQADNAPLPDSTHDFQKAVMDRMMAGYDFIEVSDRIFDFYRVDPDTAYFTWGKPGIKVYRAGTKPELDRLDRMKAEEYAEYKAKKRMAEGKTIQ